MNDQCTIRSQGRSRKRTQQTQQIPLPFLVWYHAYPFPEHLFLTLPSPPPPPRLLALISYPQPEVAELILLVDRVGGAGLWVGQRTGESNAFSCDDGSRKSMDRFLRRFL